MSVHPMSWQTAAEMAGDGYTVAEVEEHLAELERAGMVRREVVAGLTYWASTANGDRALEHIKRGYCS